MRVIVEAVGEVCSKNGLTDAYSYTKKQNLGVERGGVGFTSSMVTKPCTRSSISSNKLSSVLYCFLKRVVLQFNHRVTALWR